MRSITNGPATGLLTRRARFTAALSLKPVDRPPVWFMRQAGRHLPGYRALRERWSFLDICREPLINSQASLEPFERYGVDAVIVFNDILIPLRDMGIGLEFSPGPKFARLISSPAEVDSLEAPIYDADADVAQCLALLRNTLGDEGALLGFVGAPFTVASFAITGASTSRGSLRCAVQESRSTFERLQGRLMPVLTSYARAQAHVGADAIQVFESLAERISPQMYREVALPSLLSLVREIRAAAPKVPVIVFGRGLWPFIIDLARSGAALSLDDALPLSCARRTLFGSERGVALQGNLSPDVLRCAPFVAARAAKALLRQWREIVWMGGDAARTDGGSFGPAAPTGWIFNLAHGVPADADPDAVQAVVDAVRSFDFAAPDGNHCGSKERSMSNSNHQNCILDIQESEPGTQRSTLRSGGSHSITRLPLPSADLIARYNRPGPRYTSYPPVPYWSGAYDQHDYRIALGEFGDRCAVRPQAASLYVHVPFCERRCSFCACNVVISRDHSRGGRYLDLLEREIDLVIGSIGAGRPQLRQIHLGGGTPTWLSAAELDRLFTMLSRRFEFLDDREQSIEVDPRVTSVEQLEVLRRHGLNRVSMGVQDLDPRVQRAIRREQSLEVTERIIDAARGLGIGGVNVDLVYGLPHQSSAGFAQTVDAVIRLGVDRVALYNFAYLPERLKHHRAIDRSWLPDATARIGLFRLAAERFLEHGYEMIGLDHFAKSTDELTQARRAGTMQRNFMGYTTRAGHDLFGIGVSSISRVGRDFVQNARATSAYESSLADGGLPVEHGLRMTDDDLRRERIIQTLMCYGEVDLVDDESSGESLVADPAARRRLDSLAADSLIEFDGMRLVVTPLGRFFLRNIAMLFDAYLDHPSQPQPRTDATHESKEATPLRFSRTV